MRYIQDCVAYGIFRKNGIAYERFPDVVEDNPKASDHGPLSMDLTLL